jgi:hypothetical protein
MLIYILEALNFNSDDSAKSSDGDTAKPKVDSSDRYIYQISPQDKPTPAKSADGYTAPEEYEEYSAETESAPEFSPTHTVATNDRSNLRLRSSPSTSGEVVVTLPYGSPVQVLYIGDFFVDSDGNSGNWTYVATADGGAGWCFGAYLSAVFADTGDDFNAPEFSPTHTVATNDRSNLRLRSSPSTSGEVVVTLPYGSPVQVLYIGDFFVDSDSNSGNWTYVATAGGGAGWCFGAYLSPR